MKRLFGTPLKILGFITILLGLFLTILFLAFGFLGPIAIVVGLFLYFFDAILNRFAGSREKFWIAQCVLTILYFAFCTWSFLKITKHNSIIFPADYQGEAGIIFGIKGYPPLLETSFGKKVIEIPENGTLITSTKIEEIPISVRYQFQNSSLVDFDRIK